MNIIGNAPTESIQQLQIDCDKHVHSLVVMWRICTGYERAESGEPGKVLKPLTETRDKAVGVRLDLYLTWVASRHFHK